MKALIFAAGLGSRLKPLTNNCPKALVKVGGITLLERCIRNLISFGVDEIIVNIHHFGEQIIDFIKETDFGINIFISDERQKLLDTGGGLKHAQDFFNTTVPFFVHNVDIVSDINLSDLYHFHCSQNAMATLAVRQRTTKRYLLFDDKNQLCGRINQQTGETQMAVQDSKIELKQLAFSGIQVVSPKIFQFMPTEDVFSIVDFYVNLAKKEKIIAFQHQNGYWMDMGKIEDIFQLEQQIKK